MTQFGGHIGRGNPNIPGNLDRLGNLDPNVTASMLNAAPRTSIAENIFSTRVSISTIHERLSKAEAALRTIPKNTDETSAGQKDGVELAAEAMLKDASHAVKRLEEILQRVGI